MNSITNESLAFYAESFCRIHKLATINDLHDCPERLLLREPSVEICEDISTSLGISNLNFDTLWDNRICRIIMIRVTEDLQKPPQTLKVWLSRLAFVACITWMRDQVIENFADTGNSIIVNLRSSEASSEKTNALRTRAADVLHLHRYLVLPREAFRFKVSASSMTGAEFFFGVDFRES
jgi:hypothetical protein